MRPMQTDSEILEQMTRPRKILLIEDDDFVCQVFEAFSTYYDCVLDICHTASDGLEKIKTQEYPTIFLDIKLPDADGNEVFRLAQFMSPDSDFVVISGQLTPDVMDDIQDSGFAMFVKKPTGFRVSFMRRLFRVLNIEPLKNVDPMKITLGSTYGQTQTNTDGDETASTSD